MQYALAKLFSKRNPARCQILISKKMFFSSLNFVSCAWKQSLSVVFTTNEFG